MVLFGRKRGTSNSPGYPSSVSIDTVRTVGVNASAVVLASSALHHQPDPIVDVEATDKAMTAATIVGTVVKDVGEALEGVPLVKAVAGLVVTAVKIADECQVCKDAAKSLSKRLAKTTADIIRLVNELAPHSGHINPKRQRKITHALEEYFRLVQEIEQKLVVLKRYTKWNRLLLRRTALLRQFEDYERDMDRAAQTFQCDLLYGIAIDVAVVHQPTKQGLRSAEIPAFFFINGITAAVREGLL